MPLKGLILFPIDLHCINFLLIHLWMWCSCCIEIKKEKKTSPEKKRGPDRNLLPNPKIKILEKDPLFETKYVIFSDMSHCSCWFL